VIADFVGPAKPYAPHVAAGAEFAARQINESGGVLGRKIEILMEDDQGRPDVSATIARKLVDAGAVFILSVGNSVSAAQSQAVTKETGTPHLAPSQALDSLTTQIQNPNFWQTGPLGATHIATLLSYAKAKQFKRVAIVTDNTEAGRSLSAVYKLDWRRLGCRSLPTKCWRPAQRPPNRKCKRYEAANPEAIFLPGTLTTENGLIMRAYRQLGIKATLLGGYNFSAPQTALVSKGLLDGLVYVDAFDPAKPEVQRFNAAFKKANGNDPVSLSAYGYDGVMLAADAIKRAGSTDKIKVREAMQATRGFQGVIGGPGAAYGFADGKRTGFDPNGMLVRVFEGDKPGRAVHFGAR